MPNISFNVDYSRGSSVFNDIYNDFNKNWNFRYSAQLSFSLFTQGENKLREWQVLKYIFTTENEIQQKKIEIELKYKYLSEALVANFSAYNNLIENVNKLKILNESNMELYTIGFKDYRDVLITKSSFYNTKMRLINFKHKLLNNRLEIDLINSKWDNKIIELMKVEH